MIRLSPCAASVSTDDPVAVDRLDGAGDDDLLLRQPHPAELDREPLQRPRIAAGERCGVGSGDEAHRVEAVEDVARQADRLRELVVDVDRVEVARGARVAVRQVLVRRDPQLRDRVSRRSSRPSQTPLTMLVQVAAHDLGAVLVDGSRSRRRRSPCRLSRRSRGTSAVVVISSPEQAGSPHSKSWPPWTIVAKFIPTSGSNIAGASAGSAVDDGEHRRRDDVAEAGRRGRPRRRSGPGSRSPARVAYSLIFSRPTW